MALFQKQRRRDEIRLELLAGHGNESIEITIAVFGKPNRLTVDNLLTRELNPAHDVPDGGMEPKQGADDLFGQDEQPVAAADMHQLMTGNGFAQRRRE